MSPKSTNSEHNSEKNINDDGHNLLPASDVVYVEPYSHTPARKLELHTLKYLNDVLYSIQEDMLYFIRQSFLRNFHLRLARIDQPSIEEKNTRKALALEALGHLRKSLAKEKGNLGRIFLNYVESVRRKYPKLEQYYGVLLAFLNLLLLAFTSHAKILTVDNMYLQQYLFPMFGECEIVTRFPTREALELRQRDGVEDKLSEKFSLKKKTKLVELNMLENIRHTRRTLRLKRKSSNCVSDVLNVHLDWIEGKAVKSFENLEKVFDNFGKSEGLQDFILAVMVSRSKAVNGIYNACCKYISNVLECEYYAMKKLEFLFEQFHKFDTLSWPKLLESAEVPSAIFTCFD